METLDKLRRATKGTDYEGKLYLVGGIVRDKELGVSSQQDIDIVLEGDATLLAEFLRKKGVAEHVPVLFPRFGTAMITVNGGQVELVSARTEAYQPESRKPEVKLASLREDALRRDFTINTLLENLHTGEVIDPLGLAFTDIKNKIIRTPADPKATFAEDPLRMLRAIRFAARFDFTIEANTYEAVKEEIGRLSIVSKERIRDEFTKMLMSPNAIRGLELLRETGLISQFASELSAMYGVTQNIYHIYDCWTHTLKTLEALPHESGLLLRLAAVFHDIGKPDTRTVDEKGNVHFYTHQNVGADMTRRIMNRLRFSNDEIARVSKMVLLHLRVGEYDCNWSDAAVRRLIRDTGDLLPDLIALTRADKAASNTAMPSVDLVEFLSRVDEVQSEVDISRLKSPLCGREIMEILHISPGPILREAKEFLTNEVIEGRLRQDDKETAKRLVEERFGRELPAMSDE
ncbi:MAG: HDIG domain-containing protein [Armatimonadota bacterium]|nr:HDIG domain-containing protein [Armatimonadota bacterium]